MRLQLHRDFTFADATDLVPYMASLGVSHLYASPILAARPGSMHGYDVTDPTRVNEELGGEAGLRQLVAALRAAGLGLIVDIVPNHMAAGGVENPWWADVLRHGRDSRYATFFDIDWDRFGKVLAPFLGQPYGEALRDGTITLARDGDEPVIQYFDNQFPIRPEDHAEIAAARSDAFDPATMAGRQRLHRLLERQHYRLAWWRSAGDAINWRRFFDINGLVALRMEDAAVFEATHGTLLRLYQQGLIDGMRVDHVDGLADPPGYCRQLRARLDELAPQRPPDAPKGPPWLVVEKILGAGERLPGDWAVDGTSGYDFMDEVSALLHDGSGESALRHFWSAVSSRPADFAEEEEAARRDVLDRSFGAQLDALIGSLHRIAVMRLETRDITRGAIRRALVALLAHFPVYRSYGVGQRSDALESAVAAAMKHVPAADRPTLALLERWLGEEATPESAVRFQQLSAPLAAKAVEDTAYYRYGVLLSRNEVGADVRRFSATVADFHAACLARRKQFPDAMLATATHDHKRGEDVRARLAVLSEIPDEWERAVRRWLELNTPHRRRGDAPMPSPGDEAMLYQMIVGAWPTDELDLRDYTERLAGWQLKALREAKLATDWTAPNLEYEDAARSFLYTIMADEGFVCGCFRVCAAHRAGRSGERPGADASEADRAGRAGHLSGGRVLGSEHGGSRQSAAGGFHAALCSTECRCVTGRAGGVLAGWQGEAGGDPPRARGAPRGSGAVRTRGVSPGRGEWTAGSACRGVSAITRGRTLHCRGAASARAGCWGSQTPRMGHRSRFPQRSGSPRRCICRKTLPDADCATGSATAAGIRSTGTCRSRRSSQISLSRCLTAE